MLGQGQRRQRFTSGFEEDSGFNRTHQQIQEALYCSQLTTAFQPATSGTLVLSQSLQRAVASCPYAFVGSVQQSQNYNQGSNPTPYQPQNAKRSRLEFDDCRSFRRDPYLSQRRIQSPDLLDNRFSPETDNERHFQELVEENRMLSCQIDEGAKLVQQSKQEKANLKGQIADLEKRCAGYDLRVVELKKGKQKAEEKVKEQVAVMKQMQALYDEVSDEASKLQGTVTSIRAVRDNILSQNKSLQSECSRHKAELQNVLNEKTQAKKEAKDAKKRAIEDKKRFLELSKQKTAESESAKNQLATVTKVLHRDLGEQQKKQEQSTKEVTVKLSTAQEEHECIKKELISTQKQVALEQRNRQELELKYNKLCQQNEEKAHVFLQLQQQKVNDAAKNGAPVVSPETKTNIKRRFSDQDTVGELPLCSRTMERSQSAEATMPLEQKHARLKEMYFAMEGRLKHYQGLEEKVQKLEEKLKYYQRLEESRSKEQELSVKASIRSNELQVDLNRMRSEKQKLSTQFAALEKELQKNQNVLSDAQQRLQQYMDYFGNQTPSEISSQYQELETKNKELTSKFSKEIESLRARLNRAKHDLQVQTTSQCPDLEVAKNQADCSSELMNQLQILESESTQLKTANKQLEDVSINLSQQTRQLSARVAELEEQLDQKPKLEALMQSTQLEIKTRELKEATDKCQTLQDQLVSLQKAEHKRQNTKVLAEHKSQLDILKKVKSEEASELPVLRIQTANLEQGNQDLHQQLTQLQQRFCAKDEQVANQQQELAELRRQLGAIKAVVSSPKAQPNPAV